MRVKRLLSFVEDFLLNNIFVGGFTLLTSSLCTTSSLVFLDAAFAKNILLFSGGFSSFELTADTYLVISQFTIRPKELATLDF